MRGAGPSPSRPIGALPWTLANAGLQIATKLVALVLLSQMLSPAEFGLFYIGMSIVLIVGTIAQFGIPTNIVYLEELGRRTVAAGLWLGLGSAGAAGVLVWLGYTHLYGARGGTVDGVLLAAACYLPIQVAIATLEAVSRRAFHFRMIAVSELASTLVGSLGVAFALALLGWGVWALVAGQAVYGCTRLGALAWANRTWLGLRTRRSDFRRIAGSSLAISIAEAANVAAVYGQRPIVGAELGAAAAGIWSRFYQVVAIQLSAMVEPIDKLVLPALARQRSDAMRVGGNVFALVEVIALVTLPTALLTTLVAPIAVPLAFGPGWTALIVPLQIGSVTLFFRGVDRILLSTARATGQMGPRAFAQVVQLGIVLAGLYLTMPHGLPTVAAGYLVAQALSLALMILVVARTSEVRAGAILQATLPGALLAGTGLLATAAVTRIEGRFDPAHAILASLLVMGVVGTAMIAGRRHLLSETSARVLDALLRRRRPGPLRSDPA